MNLRGVRESVVPLVPIFLIFLITHAFAILYAIFTHVPNIPRPRSAAPSATSTPSRHELGIIGMLVLILRSYSMGAGTYTGIEAVSNGLQMLREPRVRTGKRTMRYMATSLALTASGLMVSLRALQRALRSRQDPQRRPLRAHHRTAGTSDAGRSFVLVALAAEAAILFVAAQTGFLGGPRVIATMALDRWFPTKFSTLSDRLVTQNGIILMGVSALVMMMFTGGSVGLLVILYSINVFITFVLSQLGMVRHWWSVRASERRWRKRIIINGLGLVTCAFILVSITVVKFDQGGWVTLLITGSLVAVAIAIKRHYSRAARFCQARGARDGRATRLCAPRWPRPALRARRPAASRNSTPRPRPRSFSLAASTAWAAFIFQHRAALRRHFQELRLHTGRHRRRRQLQGQRRGQPPQRPTSRKTPTGTWSSSGSTATTPRRFTR